MTGVQTCALPIYTDLKENLDLERERKKDFDNFKDKVLGAINASNTSLKQDFVTIKERVSSVQATQIFIYMFSCSTIEITTQALHHVLNGTRQILPKSNLFLSFYSNQSKTYSATPMSVTLQKIFLVPSGT